MQRVTIKQKYQVEGSRSLSRRSTGKEESNRDSQLDRDTMREPRRVKRDIRMWQVEVEVTQGKVLLRKKCDLFFSQLQLIQA